MISLDPLAGGLLRSSWPDVAWPPVLDGSAAGIAALVHRLERTQWLTTDELRVLQRRQLTVVGRWFAARSPWFADRLRHAGLAVDDLGRPGGLEALPVLTRADVQDLGDALFVAPPDAHLPTDDVRTSGSVGRPTTVRKTALSGAYFAALTMRDYLWRDLDVGGRAAVIRHTERYGERQTWGPPIDRLFRTGPSLVLPLGGAIGDLAVRLRAFEPAFLLCYPHVLDGLLDDGGIDTVRHVQTIGESSSDRLRRRAADAGLDLWDLYSSQEFGPIATECPDADGYHVMAENVVVEVVDDDGAPVASGASGHLAITDLHNFATPLLRYRLGDLAEVGDPCPCGRGLPTLRRVLGRERHLLVLPDGSRRWPTLIDMDLRAAAGVVQHQLVQVARDRVEIRVVPSSGRPLDAAAEVRIVEQVRIVVGDELRIDVVTVDGEIPRGPTGKYEEFRCEVS